MTAQDNIIHIYTDGACSGNPGHGGVGVILCYRGREKELSASYTCTTNNRMELRAVIMALENVRRKDLPVYIYSDSKYVVDAINLGWLKKWIRTNFNKKKNRDLWEKLHVLMQTYPNLHFVKVAGHADNAYNNRCDQLAVRARDKKQGALRDEGYMQTNSTAQKKLFDM